MRQQSCPIPAEGAARLERLAAFIACRRCAVGWAVYLAVAVIVVAIWGSF